jgi:hypothetical protein
VVRTDSDVVGFGHGRHRGRDGRARGKATARLRQQKGAVRTALPVGAFMERRGHGKRRLTGGPLMSAISELNLLPDENSSK